MKYILQERVKSFENWFHTHVEEESFQDLSHLRRMARLCLQIANQLAIDADLEVLLAAAYFHEVIYLPENHPKKSQKSFLSAERGAEILSELGFPKEKIAKVFHAIEASGTSTLAEHDTIEAQILQDADRIESLGILGAMKLFYKAGSSHLMMFDHRDPRGLHRPLDPVYALDHFRGELSSLETIHTDPARTIAEQRKKVLDRYEEELKCEIESGKLREATQFCHLCGIAGYNRMKLIHLEDPFAEKRDVSPKDYILDAISLTCNTAWFYHQLKEELQG